MQQIKSERAVLPSDRQVIERFSDTSEMRVLDESGSPPKIVGYAAKFNLLSNPLGENGVRFREKIDPGAFRASLADGDDVIACINHDPDRLLGRTRSGTLELCEDAKGLRFILTPADTTLGCDTVKMVRRGDIRAMSFHFVNAVDAWDRSGSGENIRTLKSARLRDISLLTKQPAYDDTEVGISGPVPPVRQADSTMQNQGARLRLGESEAGIAPPTPPHERSWIQRKFLKREEEADMHTARFRLSNAM